VKILKPNTLHMQYLGKILQPSTSAFEQLNRIPH